MKAVEKIQKLVGVISADMMMSYSEDELDRHREKLEISDSIPVVLNDNKIDIKNIKYNGDLKKKF